MALGTTAALVTGLASTALGGAASANAAGAAGRAAGAQLDEARRSSEHIEGFGRELMGNVADLKRATPQELQAYEGSLKSASNLVERDSKLLEAIDPSLLEASTQALNLMRGQDAAALAPIRNQRNAQRTELLRMLREQMGPGAETSSAGQKALQKFDLETSSLMGNAQQSTLGMFLDTAKSTRASMPGNTNSLMNVGAGFGRVADRGLTAGQATMNAMTGMAPHTIGSAGAPFVGSMAQSQGIGGMLSTVGGMFLGKGVSGIGGGSNSMEDFSKGWNVA